jgi:hypothetical protein
MLLPLQPGDEVAAMTTYQDFVLVITRRGETFKLIYNPEHGGGPGHDGFMVRRL